MRTDRRIVVQGGKTWRTIFLSFFQKKVTPAPAAKTIVAANALVNLVTGPFTCPLIVHFPEQGNRSTGLNWVNNGLEGRSSLPDFRCRKLLSGVSTTYWSCRRGGRLSTGGGRPIVLKISVSTRDWFHLRFERLFVHLIRRGLADRGRNFLQPRTGFFQYDRHFATIHKFATAGCHGDTRGCRRR
jgi:hypothetical protein